MRTTLQIDDDVLQAARSIAAADKNLTIGRVISDLARRGLKPVSTFKYRDDFPVFEVREDAPVFGLGEVKEALDEP